MVSAINGTNNSSSTGTLTELVCSGYGYEDPGIAGRCTCYLNYGMVGRDCGTYFKDDPAYPLYLLYKYLSLIIWWILALVCIWRLTTVTRTKWYIYRSRIHHNGTNVTTCFSLLDSQTSILLLLTIGGLDMAIFHLDPLGYERIWPIVPQRLMNSIGLTACLAASSLLVRFFISIHSRFDATAKRILMYIDIYLWVTTIAMLCSTLGELVNGYLHAALFSAMGCVCMVVLIIFSIVYALRTLKMATLHPSTNSTQMAQKQAAARLVTIMKGGIFGCFLVIVEIGVGWLLEPGYTSLLYNAIYYVTQRTTVCICQFFVLLMMGRANTSGNNGGGSGGGGGGAGVQVAPITRGHTGKLGSHPNSKNRGSQDHIKHLPPSQRPSFDIGSPNRTLAHHGSWVTAGGGEKSPMGSPIGSPNNNGSIPSTAGGFSHGGHLLLMHQSSHHSGYITGAFGAANSNVPVGGYRGLPPNMDDLLTHQQQHHSHHHPVPTGPHNSRVTAAGTGTGTHRSNHTNASGVGVLGQMGQSMSNTQHGHHYNTQNSTYFHVNTGSGNTRSNGTVTTAGVVATWPASPSTDTHNGNSGGVVIHGDNAMHHTTSSGSPSHVRIHVGYGNGYGTTNGHESFPAASSPTPPQHHRGGGGTVNQSRTMTDNTTHGASGAGSGGGGGGVGMNSNNNSPSTLPIPTSIIITPAEDILAPAPLMPSMTSGSTSSAPVSVLRDGAGAIIHAHHPSSVNSRSGSGSGSSGHAYQVATDAPHAAAAAIATVTSTVPHHQPQPQQQHHYHNRHMSAPMEAMMTAAGVLDGDDDDQEQSLIQLSTNDMTQYETSTMASTAPPP